MSIYTDEQYAILSEDEAIIGYIYYASFNDKTDIIQFEVNFGDIIAVFHKSKVKVTKYKQQSDNTKL